MTDVRGLTADSPFIELVGEPPVTALLSYVHASWAAYSQAYNTAEPPFQKRSEPALTRALGAYLRQRQDAGEQPFAGDFHAELSEFVLDEKSGLPKCIARTDIEWRLYGMPAFVIEFKILDGRKRRREKYMSEGVMRFVAGRYSSTGSKGAMFGLLRKAASDDPALLLKQMEKHSTTFQCTALTKGSKIVPGLAIFDSSHSRVSPHASPFHLAHLFVVLL